MAPHQVVGQAREPADEVDGVVLIERLEKRDCGDVGLDSGCEDDEMDRRDRLNGGGSGDSGPGA